MLRICELLLSIIRHRLDMICILRAFLLSIPEHVWSVSHKQIFNVRQLSIAHYPFSSLQNVLNCTSKTRYVSIQSNKFSFSVSPQPFYCLNEFPLFLLHCSSTCTCSGFKLLPIRHEILSTMIFSVRPTHIQPGTNVNPTKQHKKPPTEQTLNEKIFDSWSNKTEPREPKTQNENKAIKRGTKKFVAHCSTATFWADGVLCD